MTCELCGRSAPTITKGPFAGSEGMLDYCGYCSKNLCDSCMSKGYCSDNHEKHKHEPSGEIEESTSVETVPLQDNETLTPQIESPMSRPKREQQEINALARDWADYAGGFKQAQKIIGEAYDLGKHSRP